MTAITRFQASCALLFVLLATVLAWGGPDAHAQSSAVPLKPGIRPILGVQAVVRDTNRDGVTVDAVMPGTIAARLGIVEGDVILALNDRPTPALSDIRAVMETLGRGQRLKVRFRHKDGVLEKADMLRDVPVLPGYEVVEGRGVLNAVQIGDTRAQVEKVLGKAPGEQSRDSFVILGYPRHGMTVAMLPAEGALRVVLVRVEYPFVGTTSRGLSTMGSREDVKRLYGGDGLQSREPERVDGSAVDSVPSRGIQFISREGRVVQVIVTPSATPAASPSPSPSP